MDCPAYLTPNFGHFLSRGIYFVPAAAPRSLRYFDFATRQIHPVFEAEKDFGADCQFLPMAVGSSIRKLAT